MPYAVHADMVGLLHTPHSIHGQPHRDPRTAALRLVHEELPAVVPEHARDDRQAEARPLIFVVKKD